MTRSLLSTARSEMLSDRVMAIEDDFLLVVSWRFGVDYCRALRHRPIVLPSHPIDHHYSTAGDITIEDRPTNQPQTESSSR